jgi:hypothetical protein
MDICFAQEADWAETVSLFNNLMPRGGAPSDDQSSGAPFTELSRASAIRIATAVTRSTIVASSG